MHRLMLLAVVAAAILSAPDVLGQESATHQLLESPVKAEGEVHSVGECVTCTLQLGPAASLFGVDKFVGTNQVEFLANELFPPFRVFHFDETCAPISTCSTAFPGSTMTGITVDESIGTFWAVDAFSSGSIIEFAMFTCIPTGATCPLPAGTPGSWGPIAIDRNQPGKVAYCEDVGSDLIVEIDLVTCAIGCSFANPDNLGQGAYGNGLSDTVDPSACAGATLMVASGIYDPDPTVDEKRAVRISQRDCAAGTLCYEVCDIETELLPSGETWVNGIEQYLAQDGTKRFMLVGNATGTVYAFECDCDDCIPPACLTGIDSPDSDVLWVNSSQGGPCGVVEIREPGLISLFINAVPDGNGKYVVHLNSGLPSAGTITPVGGGLGNFCFPIFCPTNPAVHKAAWNNIGSFGLIGYNVVNGNPCIPPTPNTPPGLAFFWFYFTGPVPTWMPIGSEWTLQGVIHNRQAAANPPNPFSVTNAVGIRIVP